MKNIQIKSRDLIAYRKKIDIIDKNIVHLLAERFRVTNDVGILKKELNLPAEDKDREIMQFDRIGKLANDEKLNISLVKKIFKLIIEEVKNNHKEIKGKYII